jgi:hypothetical protein
VGVAGALDHRSAPQEKREREREGLGKEEEKIKKKRPASNRYRQEGRQPQWRPIIVQGC